MRRDAEIPRGTAGYFFREALRRLWVSKRTSFMAVAMIAISLLILGAFLSIASAFTTANVIRLTMMLYREEIEIKRLVGATERIIRGPFLIEGLLQGTLGALVAVGLLFGAYELARRLIPPASSLLW